MNKSKKLMLWIDIPTDLVAITAGTTTAVALINKDENIELKA
ncbi:hypothetical protein [Metamycoplasma gateae]|uniref:Uncharacterized protein n=1 Tax=Metamycoplasma gateae TaxID=35769 RepID=A0ABZ2AHN7_9BACT|nr:hypothetical protein V2E26_01465 [Metamycoplasma gateae]